MDDSAAWFGSGTASSPRLRQVEIRLAGVADVDAVVDLAGVVDPPSDDLDVDHDYYSHVIEHGRVSVAEASGVVVGYGGAIPVGGTCYVTDLFVHPDAHGRGLGRQLLDALWTAPAAEMARHTSSSLHPSALPLYVGAGMHPLWPLLYLEGPTEALGPTHLSVRNVEPQEAAHLEESWLGWDRGGDYAYWSSRPGARTLAVLEGEDTAAVGVLGRSRTRHDLLHLSAADPALLADAMVSVVAQVPGSVMAAVPGMSTAVPRLLDAGWHVVEHDLYCASEPDLVMPEQLIAHPGLL